MKKICAYRFFRAFAAVATLIAATMLSEAHETGSLDAPLSLPEVGDSQLRVLAPDLLELTLITTKAPPPARPTQWNFVAGNFQYALPSAAKFLVKANDSTLTVQTVGFKRRPLYAAYRKRDLRLANHLYLKLSQPIQDGQSVTVTNPDGTLWNATNVIFHTHLEA
ncbi:MAG TPA: glycoside hydrolase family 9, partial [Candidatus Kapabacteria bacterium]|nr:glycoside hydrolase family 9 [Candidatus Kapabacteria bacterium]